jgi:NTP pyrophosphatase (non-canonical NTP hydrolase)
MASFNDLEMKVLRWGEARKIIHNSTPLVQAIKTTEEVAELLSALSKNDMELAKDAYADILVTLIIGADMCGFGLVECLETGYNTIKDRTGHLAKDGTFVKDG